MAGGEWGGGPLKRLGAALATFVGYILGAVWLVVILALNLLLLLLFFWFVFGGGCEYVADKL